MNRNNYEYSARFFVIAVIGLIIVVFFLVITASAQVNSVRWTCPPAKGDETVLTVGGGHTGLLIVTSTNHPQTFNVHKVLSAAAVDSIITRFTGKPFSTAERLGTSPFYRAEKLNQTIYIEKKRVKTTRRGKLKFKKWKK